VIRVTTFETHLDALVEANRVGEMESIRNLVLGNIVFVDDGATERIRVLLHTPTLAEVVLTACAMQ
jgi:hypothetical protein